jgi:hypothetical protein
VADDEQARRLGGHQRRQPLDDRTVVIQRTRHPWADQSPAPRAAQADDFAVAVAVKKHVFAAARSVKGHDHDGRFRRGQGAYRKGSLGRRDAQEQLALSPGQRRGRRFGAKLLHHGFGILQQPDAGHMGIL